MALAKPKLSSEFSCDATSQNIVSRIPAASLALVYSTNVFGDHQLTARVADVYGGPSFDQAYAFGIRLPDYNLVNARLGIGTERWKATLFVDDLTNKLAELATNNTQFNTPQLVRVSTNQPRTFGTEINYRF
jgi:iron complex outermembrane receptor protein